MRSTLLRPMLAGSLLLAALAGVSVPSQAAVQDTGTLPADRHDDNGFDKGWLGLIGLAGLLGLKRRDDVRDRVSRNDATRSANARV
jgi:MYXO-CTERM domain-containing protein